jgi:hypothetical protein
MVSATERQLTALGMVYGCQREPEKAHNRKVLSSGIQRRVVREKSTDVSDEHVASIFRAE